MNASRFFSALLLSAVAASHLSAQCYQFSGSGATLLIDITGFISRQDNQPSSNGGYTSKDTFVGNNSLTIGGTTKTSQSTANTPDCVGCLLGSAVFNYSGSTGSNLTAFTMTVPANDTPGSMDSWMAVLGGVGNEIPTGVLPPPSTFPTISSWALPFNENNIVVATVTNGSTTLTDYPITSVGACSSSGGSPSESTTVTVNGNQGPWQQSLNPSFNYGSDDNQPPAVISSASEIPFTIGGTLTVTYLSGQVDVLPGQIAATDANGDSSDPTNHTTIATYGNYPSFFMNPSSYPVYASELVGTFANNGVIVGTPFPIGDGPATFIIPSGANQLLLGVDDNYYVDNVGSWDIKVTYAPLVVSSVVNGASFQSGIVPNSWATVGGTNLASVTDNWAKAIIDGKLPTKLDDVSVSVGGLPAYVYFISPGQINFIAPDVGPGPQQVIVTNSVGSSTAFTVTSSTFGPAFFLWPESQAVATRQDFSLAAKAGTFAGENTVAAKPGDVIILWGTGFGPTSPSVPEGEETPSDKTYSTSTLPMVTLNNISATVYGAALAPGFAGLYQVAIQVPASLTDGDWPVVATIGGVQSPSGAVLSVKQ